MTRCKDVLKRIVQHHLLSAEDKDRPLVSANILCNIKALQLNWNREQHRLCQRQTVLSL